MFNLKINDYIYTQDGIEKTNHPRYLDWFDIYANDRYVIAPYTANILFLGVYNFDFSWKIEHEDFS